MCRASAQLITLGTPHGGSYAPLQALRGVYPLVRRVAQLDPQHSAETLAREVFSTFPSLYQMLPTHFGGMNLFDARNWPSERSATECDAARPRPAAGYRRCRRAHRRIAGFGRDTVVDVARDDDDFRYLVDRIGDGTVPTARAALPGCAAWYCDIGHSELPRSPLLHAALLQLLQDAKPALLTGPPPHEPRAQLQLTDAELRRDFTDKIDWSALDPGARHRFLDSLNESTRPWTCANDDRTSLVSAGPAARRQPRAARRRAWRDAGDSGVRLEPGGRGRLGARRRRALVDPRVARISSGQRCGRTDSRLILRRGAAVDVLPALAKETGATQLYWNRAP